MDRSIEQTTKRCRDTLEAQVRVAEYKLRSLRRWKAALTTDLRYIRAQIALVEEQAEMVEKQKLSAQTTLFETYGAIQRTRTVGPCNTTTTPPKSLVRQLQELSKEQLVDLLKDRGLL